MEELELGSSEGRELALQWGHGDEAVEEPCVHGPTAPSCPLQWGHGDEAVEESMIQCRMFCRILLRWGHGDEAVEEELLVAWAIAP